MSYNTKNYTTDGGDKTVIGGTLKFEEGAQVEDFPGGSYTLPAATADTLGGIKVGDGLSITEEGVLSAGGTSTSYTISFWAQSGGGYMPFSDFLTAYSSTDYTKNVSFNASLQKLHLKLNFDNLIIESDIDLTSHVISDIGGTLIPCASGFISFFDDTNTERGIRVVLKSTGSSGGTIYLRPYVISAG